MKIPILLFLCFLSTASNLFGADTKDPLLDAQLNLVLLKLRFREVSPQVLEAKAIVDSLIKTSTISPKAHLAAIEERLVEATIENTASIQKYREKHPARVAPRVKLAFLQEALREAQQSPTP